MSVLLAPLGLSGRDVRPEPLTPAHSPELAAAVEDGQLYRLWYTSVPEPRAMTTEFRTHWLNRTNRAVIAWLGVKQDGVLRSHRRLADGGLRDTVSVFHHRQRMAGGETPARAPLGARRHR